MVRMKSTYGLSSNTYRNKIVTDWDAKEDDGFVEQERILRLLTEQDQLILKPDFITPQF